MIGDFDDDGTYDIAVGDAAGVFWVSLSTQQQWAAYPVSGASIESSPGVASLDGSPTLVFGNDEGRVFAIHADGTPAIGWPAAGLLLTPGFPIKASPLAGDVTRDSQPEVLIAGTDGVLYAIWSNAEAHPGGPIAATWRCGTEDPVILATPALGSIDGSHLDLVIVSNNGVFVVHFPSITFNEQDFVRWPWRTFHGDNARTGCWECSQASVVCSSVAGRVVDAVSGDAVVGATISILDLTTNPHSVPAVFGRSETRPTSIVSAGNTVPGDEANEGGYIFNQLPPSHTYRITAEMDGYTAGSQDVTLQSGQATLNVALTAE